MSEVLRDTRRGYREQEGEAVQEVANILFQREPEDEAHFDGCLWCRHEHTSHIWLFNPEEEGSDVMRLRYLACIECAQGKETYQTICYKQRGYDLGL